MNGKISLGSMGGLFEKPLHLAINLVTGIADNAEERQDVRRPLMALFKTVLSGDEGLSDRDFETVRHLLRDLPPHEISEMIELLRSSRSIAAEEAVERLSGVEHSEKYNILRAALRLAIRSGRMQENRQYLAVVAEGFGIAAEDFAAMEDELQMQDLRRRKLLRSGAGILVALIVLGVFVLTATLLRSVIFGLALAYVLLPVEQYFERKLANPKSFLFRIFMVFSLLGAPLRNLAGRLRRPGAASAAEKSRQVQQQRITRAVSLTGFLLLLLALGGLVTVSELSGNYVQRLKQQRELARMEAAGKTDDSAAEQAKITALEKAFAPIGESLENLRSRLDKMPLIQTAIGEVSHMLHDSAAQRELVKLILQRTGGVVSFTTGLLGALLNVLVDLLLTIFFFLLFLNKIATFCAGNAGAGRQSEYLVRTVFNGNWLPGAREETISEAERIISEIISKLKIWLRGYVTLVLIDGTVYTTVFYFLDVPYFFVLGPLAGCGVLLPYVGPVASAILTLLITLAVGGQSVSTEQICGIVAAYLIYNGIVEQFILYPMVIGESLGLSTLETIIVVLLGAIFAGIAGMIFAIPAAAVLKYLVPQIYHCFDRTPEADFRKKEGLL